MSETCKKHRIFDDSFKMSVVEEAISGQQSKLLLCKNFSLSPSVLYNWIRTFAPEYELADVPMKKKVVSENEEILSLRRALQQKELELKKATMRADFYNEMINVAEDMFNISIRKKAGTKQ